MEFKDKIKTLRQECNATLEDIGKAVGVSKATVLRWESGEIKNIRRDKIYKLAKALHTTPSYLMGWEDEGPYDASPKVVVLPVNNISERQAALDSEDDPSLNIIKLAGRDGTFVERKLTDSQLALIKSMLDQLQPIDDENI